MSALSASIPACQKRASEAIIDAYELPCGCWIELRTSRRGLLGLDPLQSNALVFKQDLMM